MNDVAFVTQLYDERIRVLSQQLQVIKCVLEHIVVEIVDDVFGHVQNGKPDEEWLLDLSHRCIQFDTDEILGVHGSPGDHVIPMFLDHCLAFIPCGGELHFHSFQSSRHEYIIGRVCQLLVQVLLHSGDTYGSLLIQHVYIFEYEWSVSEGCVCQTL